MSLTKLSLEIDENDKEKFERFCNNAGMDVSTGINIFIKTVLREHKIPFEISMSSSYFETKSIRESVKESLKRLHEGEMATKTM